MTKKGQNTAADLNKLWQVGRRAHVVALEAEREEEGQV